MHTIQHALERLRASPRAHRAVRATCRTLFYTAIALASATWLLAVPAWLHSGVPDPLRAIALLVVPGIVWLLVWDERRADARGERRWAEGRGAGTAADAAAGAC